MTCNMKTPKDAIIGDTFHRKDEPVEPLMNVSRPKPMVFAGIYPIDQTDPSKMRLKPKHLIRKRSTTL